MSSRRPRASLPLVALLAFAAGACATAVATPEPVARASEPAPSPAESEAPVTPSVVAAADARRAVAPSGKASVRVLARGANAFVAELSMDSGAAVPEHADATEEYIHVLEGSGTITIDGQAHDITAGATVFMSAGAVVSYQNGDAPMRALQVFAGPEPAAKYDAWSWDAEDA